MEYGKYEERKRIVRGLEEVFINTEYEECITKVLDIIMATNILELKINEHYSIREEGL